MHWLLKPLSSFQTAPHHLYRYPLEHWMLKTRFRMAHTSRAPSEPLTTLRLPQCWYLYEDVSWCVRPCGLILVLKDLSSGPLPRVQFSPWIGPGRPSWALLQILSSYEDTHIVNKYPVLFLNTVESQHTSRLGHSLLPWTENWGTKTNQLVFCHQTCITNLGPLSTTIKLYPVGTIEKKAYTPGKKWFSGMGRFFYQSAAEALPWVADFLTTDLHFFI